MADRTPHRVTKGSSIGSKGAPSPVLDFSTPLQDTSPRDKSRESRRTGGRERVLMTLAAQRALKAVGEHIHIARLRRGESLNLAAERAGVTRQTWAKLEGGESSVSVGLLFQALAMYGFDAQLFRLAIPESDTEGLSREAARRPKRGRSALAHSEMLKASNEHWRRKVSEVR